MTSRSDDHDVMAEEIDGASQPLEDGRYMAICPTCKVSRACHITGILEDHRPVPERNRRRTGRLQCPVCLSEFTRFVRWP